MEARTSATRTAETHVLVLVTECPATFDRMTAPSCLISLRCPSGGLTARTGPHNTPSPECGTSSKNHGGREWRRIGRDVIWFPHNTPGWQEQSETMFGESVSKGGLTVNDKRSPGQRRGDAGEREAILSPRSLRIVRNTVRRPGRRHAYHACHLAGGGSSGAAR